ncbi:MAG: DUF5979 domain-containing protein, partial [Candidatus Phosphoribacter sp.]
MLGTLLTAMAILLPAQSAQAATVTIGTIKAQMTDHRGVDFGTSVGNCIKYNPVLSGSTTSSQQVTSTNEAQTSHGTKAGTCPPGLRTSEASVVGFKPSTVTSAQDGATFLIGRMVHYNNPIISDDQFYAGNLKTQLSGFTAPNTLTFPWSLEETPNDVGNGNDIIDFDSQISTTLTQGGLSFRLVVLGFVPVANATTCPATPTGTPGNVLSTVEGTQTHACLYAAVEQARTLTVSKVVAGTAPATTFGFTGTSALDGSPWSNSTWNLSSGGSQTRELTSGNTVTVTENDPNDDRWQLTGLTCKQYAANGVTLVDVPGASLNLAARQVVLNDVPPPLSASNPGITCTYTNTYTPKATLTLVKQVQSGTAAPSLWTLGATGSVAAPPSGTSISGPSGSAAVTTQRVPAGTYALSEVGTGAAATGYVQVGDWVCRTAAGGTVPVTAGSVTLADSAAPATTANVTCTVTNRLAVGSLRISKVVDAPSGGFTGGAGKTFSGSYDCGDGFTGTFTTLTTSVPVTITGIPAGRTCLVTESLPSGGLANASYAWTTPTFTSQPVTINDGTTADVTISNPVVQNFGALSLTKEISGPGGYTGGSDRVFPVSYTCTLADGPTTSGTFDLTSAQAATRTDIPTGSVCSFSETLTAAVGDFADPSYVWGGVTFSPSSVTIGERSTVEVTVTNTYLREFGSLVFAKVVEGDGYLGGSDANFMVRYDCGSGTSGQVAVAAGSSTTIPNVPARHACSAQEVPADPGLLSPAYVWGAPSWSPGPTAMVPADGSATLTVTNPTVAVFGHISVTKVISGDTHGVEALARFDVRVDCGAVFDQTFSLAGGARQFTPNLPVGTSCTITETPPSAAELLDSSYAWGPSPSPQVVTITQADEVLPVTVTNTIVRVRGSLQIGKAPIQGGTVVDPARAFVVDYSCQYNGDAPVTGTVTLSADTSSTIPDLFLGSLCTVTEQSDTLSAPPSAGDPSWVWLPPTYSPGQDVIVSSVADPATVTVTNAIQQVTGSFRLSKAVAGRGKEGGYTPGATFTFQVTCSNGFSDTVVIADAASWEAPDLPAFASCTVTETVLPPTSPNYLWEPVQFSVNGEPSGVGASVTFEILNDPARLTVVAGNTISERLGSVRVTKTVTGLTAGLAPGAPDFEVTLICGPGYTYPLLVPAGGSVTQDDIPAGRICTVSEAAPSGGLVDESYAWGAPVYTPADGTVTVEGDTTVNVGVENPIVRVTAPVTLVKTFTGAQGVIDPARTYPVTWTCTYGATQVGGGLVDIVADPAGVIVAADVPVTSTCTATEGDLGAPSVDPAFRWLGPVITGTTVIDSPHNTITVANTLTRDSGTVLVRKQVIGEVGGYLGTGEDFTLHGSCFVPGHPEIPTRYADGVIADGGEVPITASIGWTCSGYEDTPSQSLLTDTSYAWGPALFEPAEPFTLTRQAPTQIFLAQNPIVRVSSSF